jgi:hypothetical protein
MDEYASINAEYEINVAKIEDDLKKNFDEITEANKKWINDNLPEVADVKAAYAIDEPEIGLAVRVLMRQPYQDEFRDMTRGHDNQAGMKTETIAPWLGFYIKNFNNKMRVEKEKIEKLKGDIFSPDDYKKRVNGWLNTYWMDKKIYDLYDNIRERILALEAKKNADIKRIKEKQKTEIERKEIEQRAAMIKQNKIKSPSLKSNTPSVNRKLIKRRKSEILKKAYSALERRNSMKKSGGQRRRKSRKTYKKRI